MKSEKNLVWLDCEMTGLDMKTDVILEIACVVTDGELNVVAEGPSLVIHQSDEVLENMGPWCRDQHKKSGLTQDVRQSLVSLAQAEEQILEFLQRYCFPNKSPMCGSSVWVDRVFIMRAMPKLNNFFHYRNVDVAAVKELVARWYDFDAKKELPKKDAHRALPDIYESINELKFYRERFFVATD